MVIHSYLPCSGTINQLRECKGQAQTLHTMYWFWRVYWERANCWQSYPNRI